MTPAFKIFYIDNRDFCTHVRVYNVLFQIVPTALLFRILIHTKILSIVFVEMSLYIYERIMDSQRMKSIVSEWKLK